MNYCSANEIFQSRLINCVALTEIDRARFFGIKAGIEECMRIFQESALKKVHFYCFLESADRTNQSLVRPDRGLPLPFLSDVGISLQDKFAQSGDHVAAPVGKFRDLCVDAFRWIHVLFLALQYFVATSFSTVSFHASMDIAAPTRLHEKVTCGSRDHYSRLKRKPVSLLGPKGQNLLNTINGINADGNTRLFDTIAEQVSALQALPSKHIKAIVVLTDGMDNISHRSVNQLVSQITPSGENAGEGIKVFTIAYGSDADVNGLTMVANDTGGQEYAGTPQNIRQVYLQISEFF
jgi:hypothetical protein